MKRPKFDWILVLPILFLISMSLTVLRSVAPQLFLIQLNFVLLSAIVFVIISSMDFELLFSLHAIPYSLFLLLTILTSVFGFISRGAQRWLTLGPFTLQPSEILKPFMLITLSSIAVSRSSHKLLRMLLIGLIPILSVFLQPDLGTTLVLLVGWISIVFSRFPFKLMVLLSLFFALTFIPFYKVVLHDYQRQRIATFIDPYRDPLGSGYHVIQSVIAVGSGQVTGRGLGHGTQTQLRFLPEHHTDFIFASLSEELGFIGAFFCLILYGIIYWRIYSISQQINDPHVSLFCLSSLALLGFQTFVNIAMNLGIAPITGITLPFLSYGGSSLLSVSITLGILNSISTKSHNNPIIIIH
jgi:rod shape determining protein RodA